MMNGFGNPKRGDGRRLGPKAAVGTRRTDCPALLKSTRSSICLSRSQI